MDANIRLDATKSLLIWTAWSEVEGNNKLKQIIYIITCVSSFHRSKTRPPSMLGALISGIIKLHLV